MMKLIIEELCDSSIAIAKAYVGKDLELTMMREAEKFYDMFLMFDAVAGTITPAERPF